MEKGVVMISVNRDKVTSRNLFIIFCHTENPAPVAKLVDGYVVSGRVSGFFSADILYVVCKVLNWYNEVIKVANICFGRQVTAVFSIDGQMVQGRGVRLIYHTAVPTALSKREGIGW